MPELDINALLTTKEAADYAGKTVSAISKWRERGWLPVAKDAQGNEIRDERGWPRYRLIDVAKAENATRQRREAMVRGILGDDEALAA